jgi:signal transduction histidine kinase
LCGSRLRIPAPGFLRIFFQSSSRPSSKGERSTSGGLGLGLAIARMIVERHGGKLQATSQGIELGATFSIELPVAKAEEVSSASPREGRSLHLLRRGCGSSWWRTTRTPS